MPVEVEQTVLEEEAHQQKVDVVCLPEREDFELQEDARRLCHAVPLLSPF